MGERKWPGWQSECVTMSKQVESWPSREDMRGKGGGGGGDLSPCRAHKRRSRRGARLHQHQHVGGGLPQRLEGLPLVSRPLKLPQGVRRDHQVVSLATCTRERKNLSLLVLFHGIRPNASGDRCATLSETVCCSQHSMGQCRGASGSQIISLCRLPGVWSASTSLRTLPFAAKCSQEILFTLYIPHNSMKVGEEGERVG